ncbi:DUF806 family protein [Liquorilactobacillus mali]|uniref:DUF806 family protein n=1 Tax=Liquorilactobacillus mali TaxID=1618 RepID=UPI0026504FB4|nr:DUF806 family protein [Liquorilactobacillus mali]MDN7145267.1 DUF806 family protein [Liquorilactobacillus mali]
MTPAAYVKGILTDNINTLEPLSVDHIYAFLIPQSEDTTAEPVLVVSEAPDYDFDYGNNVPIQNGKRIQIEFYYPKDYAEDMEAIESAVEKLLLSKGIYCFSNAGHVITPDSENIINTLKFNYIKEVI